jgi:type II secretory pathway component GspD/PulD (secretin)
VRAKTTAFGTIVSLTALLTSALLLTPVTVRGQDGESGVISLDADSTSVNGILQILAQRSGLNIVTGPELQGRRISIHLKNTPFEEALNLVVRAAGLGYERVGSSILVASPERLSTQTGMVARVFDLGFARAQDVKDQLEYLCKDVTASISGDRILARASASTMEQVAQIVALLDRKPAQVLLQVRMIEVNTGKLLEVGIDWEKITKWGTVLTEGDPGSSRANQLPENLDYLKLDDTQDFYRQMASFQVQLDALLSEGNARLVSDLKIVTLDNTPAEIFAGETVPVIITSLQAPGGAGGTLQTVQLEKIDVGVKLHITPRISEDGFISALVEPEVSRIVAFVGPNDDLPQTSTRRARTLVRVRDGERIYIGGLLSEEKRRSVKKVPLLGQIPLLGLLFQHHRDETNRFDLVIEITPRIVGDEGASLPVVPSSSTGAQ